MKRVLYIGDACASTGFARTTHAMCDRLVKKYDLAVFGILHRGDPHPYDYPIYPASFQDTMGFNTLPRVLKEFNPDVVVIQHDPWVVTGYLTLAPELIGRTVAYYLSDGPLMQREWVMGLAAAGVSAPYTRYAAEQLRDTAQRIVDYAWQAFERPPEEMLFKTANGPVPIPFQKMSELTDLGNHHIVGAGVDAEKFFPYSTGEKRRVRERLGIPADAFVVGTVGTNTPRKHPDLAMQAFSKVLKKVPNAVLVMHTTPRGAHDLLHLADYYGVGQQVYFTADPNRDMTDEEMRDIYNCFDVSINTAGGEGFGLPLFEAAACGVPQLIPDWGPLPELWEDAAVYIPIRTVVHDTYATGVGRGLIDTDALAEEIVRMTQEDYRTEKGQAAYCRATDPYFHWDNAAERMSRAIEVVKTNE